MKVCRENQGLLLVAPFWDVRSGGLPQAKIHPGNWWRVCSSGDSLAVRLAPRHQVDSVLPGSELRSETDRIMQNICLILAFWKKWYTGHT